MFIRNPDVVIGGFDDPYLLRWWIIPKNKYFNIYLHKFLRSDDDRALHDHPWWSLGMILHGVYNEVLPDMTMVPEDEWSARHDPSDWAARCNRTHWRLNRAVIRKLRHRFQPVLRKADHIHRVELLRDGAGVEVPVWTIFITGPKIRDWGFWCPKGWRLFSDYLEQTQKGQTRGNHVGRGCDD